ncbi:carbohydrate kinase [Streptacidiphilus sp. P02-A3a]|uniref:carbohydrate kinase family protein n=1 Tax=Streptacidiphilus sp. P02-A3a TaxID=2704468 RepID=UPI0015FC2266|nr:carbohydrate kinase [Streptacidiphilus sp. P02-A3a]QMU68784.1 carbohydrate kinase [Streptacidiphilus sp. P02-A3a]
MTDFLVIGESVADIVRSPGREDVTHPGGSPANVAYGLARLGHATTLLTQLGADPAGGLIADHLRSAGVALLADDRQRTPTAVVTLDEHGSARYAFDIDWTLQRPELPRAPGHLHFGSIAAVREPGATATLAAVARLRQRATVSYDPNVRVQLMGERAAAVAQVERCVALSDLVKASDEDLDWLYPGEKARSVAARWLALGPAAVLVTRGGDGSTGFTRTGSADAAVPPTTVADTVGAGDSFMAATLDALAARGLLGAPARPGLAALPADLLGAVLRHAADAAAITVSRPGANPPTAEELGRFAAPEEAEGAAHAAG